MDIFGVKICFYLSREQFPTGSRLCLLEEGITLCSDEGRVDNSSCSLTDVASALSRYKAAQDEITQCNSQVGIALTLQLADLYPFSCF